MTDIRFSLAEVLSLGGFEAAGEVLKQEGRGVISLPESLKDTRDGREEAIQALQEAFEDPRIACIVIERGA